MVAVDFGVVSGATITVGGPTQTLIASGMVEVPKFALLWLTAANTIGAPVNEAMLAIGMTDGTNSRTSSATHQNTGGNSLTRRRGASTLLQITTMATGVVLAQASFVSFSAGSITIQWDTTTFALPAAAYRIGGVLIGGTSFSALVGNTIFNGTGPGLSTTVITSPVVGEAFIFLQDRSNFDNNTRTTARTVIGVASCDFSVTPSTVTQFCVSHGENSGLAAADPWMRVQTDASAGRIAKTTNSAGDGNGWDFIGSDGVSGGRFVIRARDTATVNEGCGWAALNFGGLGPGFPGAVKHGVFVDSMPTATGAKSHPVSFVPQGVIFLPTLVDIATPATTVVSAQGGAVGIGTLNLATRFAVSMSTRDGAAALTRSYADSQGINLLLDTGTLGFRATLTALTSTNIQVNYTAVSGVAAILGYLAIGQSPSGSTVHPAALALAAPTVAVTLNRALTVRPAALALAAPLVNVANVNNPPISSTVIPATFALSPVPPVVTVTGLTALGVQPAAFGLAAPTPAVLVNKLATIQPAAFALSAPRVVVTLQAVTNITLTVLPAAFGLGCSSRGVFISTTQPSSFKGTTRFGGATAGQAKFGGTVAGMTRFGQP